MNNIERMIKTFTELGAANALVTLGLSSGEISQRKARDTYGKWFTDAVRHRRLLPCRVEDGRAGTHWYNVKDILALKAADALKAELIFKNS